MRNGQPVIIGWTDEHGTYLDIQFSYMLEGQGDLQRGLQRYRDLFVAIVGIGMHGFTVDRRKIDEGYIISKYEHLGFDDCSAKLTELINGVRCSLYRTYKLVTIDGQKAITCLTCGKTSYNSNDIEQKYCGCCYKFHRE